MNDQTKTPGATVLVERELLERLQMALSTSYCPETSLTTELWKLLSAEQTPAVGGKPFCFTTYGMIGIAEAMREDGGTGRIGCKFKPDTRFCAPLYEGKAFAALQDEIEELRTNTMALEGEALEAEHLITYLRCRLAELEAQQEPTKLPHSAPSTWPAWAQFVGLDPNGFWVFYESKPETTEAGRIPKGRFEKSVQGEAQWGWAEMIYGRPVAGSCPDRQP